jgi:hypothetical protein
MLIGEAFESHIPMAYLTMAMALPVTAEIAAGAGYARPGRDRC